MPDPAPMLCQNCGFKNSAAAQQCINCGSKKGEPPYQTRK